MKRFFKYFAATAITILVLLFGLSIAATEYLFDEQLNDNPNARASIAPLDKAYTFARTIEGKNLLVLDANKTGVIAVDMTEHTNAIDGIEAYNTMTKPQLDLLAKESSIEVPWEHLSIPFIPAPGHHIAAGANYAKHAEEVGHEEDPFLFPKLTKPTAWNAPVATATRLDFEVELCAVTLKSYQGNNPKLGFLLCNDFTRRVILATEIDLEQKMGTTGFPNSKGGKTHFPLGPLLVIPNDDSFYKEIELRLYANGRLRQKSLAEKMIWSPEKIMEETLADCETPYYQDENIIELTSCDEIQARKILLTGTPEGVIFNVRNLINPFVYLRGGDIVVTQGSYLGSLVNVVSEDL